MPETQHASNAKKQTNEKNNNYKIVVGSGDVLVDWVESADDCVYIQIVFFLAIFSGVIDIEIEDDSPRIK